MSRFAPRLLGFSLLCALALPALADTPPADRKSVV